MVSDNLGKKAEAKIKAWLDRPEEGYCFDRISDQMTGFYGSTNICDFTLFKSPHMYYIESKATWSDRFDFSMISGYDEPSNLNRQYGGLLNKSKISGVYGIVIVLFAEAKRAFIIDIQEIDRLVQLGKKSLNIKKIQSWGIKYREIETIQSGKALLDYRGEFDRHEEETC